MRRVVVAILIFLAAWAGATDLDTIRAYKLTAPKKWAIVIGASEYRELGVLKYTRADAQDFAAALTRDFGFKSDDVALLVDGDRPANAPTAKNVLSTLDRVLGDKRLDRGDLFIFYFSGHGVGTKSGDYLCPTDTTATNVEQVGIPIRSVMARLVKAGLRNVLIICDACRAGTKNPFGSELQALANKANVAVLLGCAPGRRSYEEPRFKHGVFTHFLLENLRDENLREPSGVLWASNVAEKLKQQVFAYTQPEHGKFAQEPATWNEKRQDVLLAQFAPKTTFGAAIALVSKEVAQKKGPDAYARALEAAAVYLSSEGMPSAAVDYLKTLDSLGAMTSKFRFLLAHLLRDLGRDAEAERQYLALMKAPEGDYYRIAARSDRMELKAAIQLWEIDRTFDSATWAWNLARLGSPSDRTSTLATLIRYYKSGGAAKFFAALSEAEKGRRERAIPLFEQALTDDEVRHSSLLELYRVQAELRNDAAQAAIIARGIRDDPGSTYFWIGEEADRLKSEGKGDAMMAILVKIMQAAPDPGLIYEYVDTAGWRAHELIPGLEKQLKRHPYSWPVHAALWIANQSKDLEASFTLSEEMKKYAGDPVELRLTVFKTLSRMIEDKEDIGATDRMLFNTKFTISLVQFQDRFKADDSLWYYLQRWSENCRRSYDLDRIAEACLYPAVTARKCSLEAMSTALTIAMNAGNDEAVDSTWQAIRKSGGEKSDDAWRYLVYLLARDRDREAEALLPKMPTPSDMVGAKIPAIARAYLDARKGGDKAKIQAELDANEPDGIESTYLWMLTAYQAGREERASNFTIGLFSDPAESYLHLRTALYRRLCEDLTRQKKTDDRFAVVDALSSSCGNPLFDGLSFGPSPSLQDFAGDYQFEAEYRDQGNQRWNGKAKLHLTITPDGKMSGTMVGLTFAGKIDAKGNLRVRGTWDGQAVWLSAKLAPPGLYVTYADKGDQSVLVLDEHFGRTIIQMRPVRPRPVVGTFLSPGSEMHGTQHR